MKKLNLIILGTGLILSSVSAFADEIYGNVVINLRPDANPSCVFWAQAFIDQNTPVVFKRTTVPLVTSQGIDLWVPNVPNDPAYAPAVTVSCPGVADTSFLCTPTSMVGYLAKGLTISTGMDSCGYSWN